MKIDLDQFKTNGQAYIDTLVAQLKEEGWENLRFSKFQNNSPDELELMKALWSHGFTSGAEASTNLSIALHDALVAKKT